MKKNFYYYLFFRLYLFYKTVSAGTNDTLEYSAVISLSVLISLNFVTLSALLELNGCKYILNSEREFLGVGIFIIIINYFIFIQNKKYIRIIADYSKYKSRNKGNSSLFLLYFVFTIWSTFSIGGEVREMHIKQKSIENKNNLDNSFPFIKKLP
jgi:hypothetical protein